MYDIFSKRHKKIPDVYQYDDIPKILRAQIIHMFNDSTSINSKVWETTHKIICREYGCFSLFHLEDDEFQTIKDECCTFILNTKSTNKFLDFIETFVKNVIIEHKEIPYHIKHPNDISMYHKELIETLNYRFKENGFGYEFQGQIIKINNTITHQNIINAINLTNFKEFKGANEEFLKAHSHYRKKHYKESINEALKAFESTMKSILFLMKIETDVKDTAVKLINKLVDNEIIPQFLDSHVKSLKSTLEGLSTLRNKTSSHGQGVSCIKINEHFAHYAINLAAVNIIFLIDSYKKIMEDK